MADKLSQQLSSDLSNIVRGDVFSDFLNKAAFSTDASIYQVIPSCIVAPKDRADIASVVNYAKSRGIPIAARGAGSGLAGESLCSGIVFDMRRYMNKIVGEINDAAFIICEPGTVLDDLNNYLASFNRKIGPDPSTNNRATIGGCVANNATGAHSLAYGYIGDYLESLETVLSDGSVVEFKNDFVPTDIEDDQVSLISGNCMSLLSKNEDIIKKALPQTKRNRSGYNIAGILHEGCIDMAKLLAGSEGTLAVFTKITLRTVTLPSSKALLQLEFKSLEKVAKAVPIIVETGACACELMDKNVIEMAIESFPEYKDILPAGAEAVLLVEQSGQDEHEVCEKIKKTDSAVGKLAAGRRTINDEMEQRRLWKSRKDAVPLIHRKKGKAHPIPFIEDVSVSNDKLEEYLSGLKEISKQHNLDMTFYGHAGDGELHVRPYIDLSEQEGIQTMLEVANDVFSLAWSLGGTISGEHADGLVRAAFIKQQYGEKFYRILCEIKNIFDPDGIMNPGKIINTDDNVMIKNLKAQHQFIPERLSTDLFFEKDELRDEMDQCNGCGLCLNKQEDLRMCPVFRAMDEELANSRAKANLLRFWATGQLGVKDFESPEFGKFLDLCINCKLCSLQCPSGVDVSKLVSTARAEYVKRTRLHRTKLLLSNNRYLSMLGNLFSPVSNLVLRLGIVRWLLQKAGGLDKRRRMPRFSKSSFIKKANKYLQSQPKIEEPIDRTVYFVDTYANYNDHDLGFAVLKVLRANNIEVALPKQRPVPLPAICYGDVKTAKRDLSYDVKQLISY
ncbi:MAG: FAD-binding and (Fe-S)-binding domain-containing protein, partial [Planctomycetota bacterium]